MKLEDFQGMPYLSTPRGVKLKPIEKARARYAAGDHFNEETILAQGIWVDMSSGKQEYYLVGLRAKKRNIWQSRAVKIPIEGITSYEISR